MLDHHKKSHVLAGFAAAIAFVIVCPSPRGTEAPSAGVATAKAAEADPAAPAMSFGTTADHTPCRTWKVQARLVSVGAGTANIMVPDDWEPFGGGDGVLWIRTCVNRA